MFDTAQLKLPEDTWCWPSGFFAKAEFGVGHGVASVREDGAVLERSYETLTPDLRAALVGLPELRRMGAAREYSHFGEAKHADVVPYNEVYAAVDAAAVVVVFARSTQLHHLLWVMAARDAIARARGAGAARVAVLVLDAGGGERARAFPPRAQAALLRRVACDAARTAAVHGAPLSLGALGLDVAPLGLGVDAALRVHGACLLADAALAALLDTDDLPRRAVLALQTALASKHARAAKAIVRCVGCVRCVGSGLRGAFRRAPRGVAGRAR
ncbi:hypothetical protein M885DRAFT_552240 [Pelagophyceae sp. CCMP2097]|nr:hypothetical protein M885DRAFT_552240 [Pelagophyceae sp. CCMP2097]